MSDRGGLSAFEYQRLVTWMKDKERKPAIIAFTSGVCRDAARAFEEAVSTQTMPPSPKSGG